MIVSPHSRQLGKAFIHPKNFSCIVQQRIWNFKLIQKFFLYRCILCGKIDNLICKPRSGIIIQSQFQYKIDSNKYRQQKACRHIVKIKPHICDCHRDRQPQWPAEIRSQLSPKSNLWFHLRSCSFHIHRSSVEYAPASIIYSITFSLCKIKTLLR